MTYDLYWIIYVTVVTNATRACNHLEALATTSTLFIIIIILKLKIWFDRIERISSSSTSSSSIFLAVASTSWPGGPILPSLITTSNRKLRYSEKIFLLLTYLMLKEGQMLTKCVNRTTFCCQLIFLFSDKSISFSKLKAKYDLYFSAGKYKFIILWKEQTFGID